MSLQIPFEGINPDSSDHQQGGNRTAKTHVLKEKEVWKEGGSVDENRNPIGLARRIEGEKFGCHRSRDHTDGRFNPAKSLLSFSLETPDFSWQTLAIWMPRAGRLDVAGAVRRVKTGTLCQRKIEGHIAIC